MPSLVPIHTYPFSWLTTRQRTEEDKPFCVLICWKAYCLLPTAFSGKSNNRNNISVVNMVFLMVLRKDWNKNKLLYRTIQNKRQESDGKKLQFYLLLDPNLTIHFQKVCGWSNLDLVIVIIVPVLLLFCFTFASKSMLTIVFTNLNLIL